MRKIHRIEFKNDQKEELLPGYSQDFPYIASWVDTDQYIGQLVPWHWHREVELFYMVQGTLEYFTPTGRYLFPTGSGGLVNSNVLHMTRPSGSAKCINILHIFDPALISGGAHSRIDRKYISPLVTSPQIDVIGLYPDQSGHEALLKILFQSFQLSETESFYEMRLRSALSQVWCGLLDISGPLLNTGGLKDSRSDEKIKRMLAYIQEHFREKLSVAEIAASAYISERECFRTFKTMLHTTPLEYLKCYRLQAACRLLADTADPVTYIGQRCGLGSSSYFGRTFRSQMGCTPAQYRLKWRDRDINGQN